MAIYETRSRRFTTSPETSLTRTAFMGINSQNAFQPRRGKSIGLSASEDLLLIGILSGIAKLPQELA
jgi:hypothetical protein